MKTKNKSQSEIVGFAVIIVIVTVIGLIFLSISIGRGEKIERTSVEISDFLQSTMYHTTNCTTTFTPNYESIQELIKACYRNENCINLDKQACAVLEEDYSKIVKHSFNVSDDSRNKAYKLEIYYENRREVNASSASRASSNKEEIMNFTEGNFKNCSSEAGASQAIDLYPGSIKVELDMCYG
ncbi:MAG: hypothetical protein PHH54_02890 [Candidatus Nanoarchaeia archaeon]|nr:hypothetical protein [Candidatus Nanoarchaeia archaeon]MDD5740906.1 hypothetical protein [Candidatus Nanoarchaeia archaeon]